MNFKNILIFLIFVEIYGCKETTNSRREPSVIKKRTVFNYDNKIELSEFNTLNLDKTHPNLLNPKISKSEYKKVVTSWTELQQNIGKYLADKKFNWNVKDSTITIIQKFYFNKEGKIENYFFRLKNKNISNETKEEYANLIYEFTKDHKINFKREEVFAQCGKVKYLNK